MCLIEPSPRSATIIAAIDADCLATSYAEFIATIEENPPRAVDFMKTLVRRLWLMSVGPYQPDPEVAALSWRMLC
jgi:CRP-like cAMP-binding protein